MRWIPLAIAVGGSVALLIGAALTCQAISRARAAASAVRYGAERAASYHVFVELWGEVLCPGRPDAESRDEEEEMRALDRLVLMYGSRDVLRAHAQLRARVRLGGGRAQARADLVDALLAIRRDLGAEPADVGCDEINQLIAAASEAGDRRGAVTALTAAPCFSLSSQARL